MIANIWMRFRDDFTWPAENPEDDDELQAKNREALSRAVDYETVSRLYKQESAQGKTWTLLSLWYQYELENEVEQAVERLSSENPGQTDVLGAWYADTGERFGTADESPPTYPQYGALDRYMPDNPDGTPNPIVRDVNLLAGQALRVFFSRRGGGNP